MAIYQATSGYIPESRSSTWKTSISLGLAIFALAIALIGSNFSYLVLSWFWSSEGAGRSVVFASPELVLGVISILVAQLISFSRKTKFGILPKSPFVPLFFLWFCICWMLLGLFVRDDPPELRKSITFLSLPLYVMTGRVLGRVLFDFEFRHLRRVLLAICMIWPIFFIAFAATGRVSFNFLHGTNFRRLGISGGIESTEIAILTGGQFIYLLFIMMATKNRSGLRLLTYVLLAVNLGLLYATSSVGPVIGYAFVFVIYLYLLRMLPVRRTGWIRMAVGGLGILFVACISGYLGTILSSLLWKTDQILQGGGREAIYSLLWQIALDRPIWGIGLGRFVQINNLGWLGVGVYPHNNFLGIAAETGFIASLAYFFFVISSTYWGLRLIKRVKTRGNSLTGAVLFIPFSMLIYHQFRGLLQDTWTVKEVYLWVGVMAGISDRLAVLKYA